MASPLSPLLEIKDDSASNTLRKCSLICHPLTLLTILALSIIAFFYPLWNGDKSILSFTAHPFIETEHPSSHSLNTESLSNEALSDLVTSLPGLDDSIDFAQYSGYIDALNGRQLHYWFFEAQHNADTAPLFFWTNGGPGCSGLCGLLTEHGPFWTVNDDELMINRYSWNNEVNIVYLEQPYGVGFSVIDEGFNAISGDKAAVADFDAAIRSFIIKFPVFMDRDIYLSSESFGGHYMALTALEIMNNNDIGNIPHINLAGFIVGNPYISYHENTIGAMEAFYGHGLMRNDVYETWEEYCFGEEDAMDNAQCRYLYLFAYSQAENIDHYALDFDVCIDDISWNKNRNKGKHKLFDDKLISNTVDKLLNEFESDVEWDLFTDTHIRPLFKNKNRKRKRKTRMILLTRKDAMDLKEKKKERRRRLNIEWEYNDISYFPCAAELMTNYLNEEDVQSALNVKNTDWTMCNDDVFDDWPQTDWDNEMQPYYAELAAKYPELKILIYSGDDDSVCGIHGTQYWLDNMGQYGWRVDTDTEWVQWMHNNQLAGYKTIYFNQNGDVALNFYTIRSAGHMAPQTQPSRALALLTMFLNEME